MNASFSKSRHSPVMQVYGWTVWVTKLVWTTYLVQVLTTFHVDVLHVSVK